MRTDLGNGMVVDTNGYDAVAEIESTGDKYGTAKYIRKRKKECEEQARQYLAEHPKTDLYVMHGYPTMFDTEDNDPDENYIQFTVYTEEEIRRIKELFFELWNEGFEDPSLRAKSFEDIPQSELSLTEFEGANDELDALVWDRAREQDFVACWIDWLHPVHAYHFSTWEYNRTKDEMYPRKAHYRVQLTDEEYLYLLTEQLFDRHFTFNRLMLYNAPLAQKICNATDGDLMLESLNPYLIIMEEVMADVEQIAGNIPVSRSLYEDTVDGIMKHVHMNIEHNKIEIFWQTLPEGDFGMNHLEEGYAREIDAFAVQKLIGGKNFDEMADLIHERFAGPTAYEDFLAFIHENGIYELSNHR